MKEPSDALHELVAAAELTNIACTEMVARRGADYSKIQDRESIDARPAFTLSVDPDGKDVSKFSIGLRVQIDTQIGEIVAATVGEYRLKSDAECQVTEEVLLEYGNHVGVMTLLPYLRQAVADLTQRVFESPLLIPVMARGHLWFTEREEVGQTVDDATSVSP